MKKLYMIRHAKSSWKDMTLEDFERPLNKRGEKNAPEMGDRLKAKKVKPDLILSSPALRAKTTAEIIAKRVKYKDKVVFNEDIYEASAKRLHGILKKIKDEYDTVFLIGHNPGLNMLAEKYVDFYENIPTCGIVEIEFDCERWISIDEENASLISFDYPKQVSNE